MSEYRTLLVAYDHSAHSRAALLVAKRLASLLRADLHFVHVLPPAPRGHPRCVHAGRAVRALEIVARSCRDLPCRIATHVVDPDPADVGAAIRETAREIHADLLVMGAEGRTGFANVFISDDVTCEMLPTPCPVVTVQGGG